MSTNVGQINYVVNLDTSKALADIDQLQKKVNDLRANLGKPISIKTNVDSSAFNKLNQQAQNVGKQLQSAVSKTINTKIKVDNSDLAYTQRMFDKFKLSAKSGGVFNPQVDNKRFLTGINAMENQVKAFKTRAEVPVQVQVNAKNLQSLNTELARVGKTMPELKNALANGMNVNKFFADAKALQSESLRIQTHWAKMSSSITKGTENMINGFARFTRIVGKFTVGAGLIGFGKIMKDGFNSARNIQDSLEALDNANVFENYSNASKQLIKDWAELNKTAGKFDANGVLKEGAKYASISQADYVEGAEKLGLYLKDFKMSDQQRVDAIKEFNALTADMSSFWNKDIADLQDTLVRYFSGRSHSINMLVKGYDNFNIPQLNHMAEELFGKSFSKLDLASQKLVRVQYLFDSMGITMDDNAKTMFTFNTAVRRIGNNIKDISTGAWQLLLPTTSKMLDKISWKLQGLGDKIRDLVSDPERLAQAGQQIEQFIFGKVIPMVKRAGAIIGALMFGSTLLKITGLDSKFAQTLPKLIGLAGKGGIEIGKGLGKGFSAWGGELTKLSIKMPSLLAPIASGFGSVFGEAGVGLAGLGGSIGTLGVGLAALPIIIAGVGGAFQGLFQTIQQLPTTIDKNLGEGTFGKLSESLEGVKQNTFDMFSGLWGILQQFFGGIWSVGQSIGGAIGNVFGAIMLGVGPILQFFTTIWDFVVRFIEKTGIIQIFFDAVSSFITGIGNTLSSFLMPIFQAIGDVFRDYIQPAIQPLLDKLMEYAPKIQEFFAWLLEQINTYLWPYIQQIAGFLGDILVPIISTVGGWVGWVIGKVVDGLLWVWGKLEWLWGKLQPFFDKIKGAWDGLMTGIKGAFDSLIDGIKWLWNNTVVAWLNKAIEWANWIPGVDIGPVPEWHSSDFIVDDSDVLQRHLDMANEINGRMARARNTLFSTQRDTMRTQSKNVVINIDNSNSVIPEKFANEIITTTMTTLGGAYGLVR